MRYISKNKLSKEKFQCSLPKKTAGLPLTRTSSSRIGPEKVCEESMSGSGSISQAFTRKFYKDFLGQNMR